jgi:adenylyltransferase/sulfurtransferase
MSRYQRQLLLPGWGPDAQAAVGRAKVIVIGAGGLGCPALQYLAAAGVGTLGIVDGDRVSVTDLHRQILYTAADVDALKADCAEKALHRINPEIDILAHPGRLTVTNALELLQPYDVVLDASDNFGTRYMVNDACALLGLPLVYGSVSRFEGQVAVFHGPGGAEDAGGALAEAPGGADYRDLFPRPPAPGEVPSCEEAGVLGVVAGIIGNLQALEVLKLITGLGTPLAGRLLTYRALDQTMYTVGITPGLRNGPHTREAFLSWPYPDGCGPAPHGGDKSRRAADKASAPAFTSIDNSTFDALRARPDVLVLDVREWGERPSVHAFAHDQYPLSQLRNSMGIYTGRTIVVFCQSGLRSREAAALLAKDNTVYQLEGGILGWMNYNARTI